MTRHFLKFFRQEIGAASVVAPSPASMFAHPQGGDELGPGQAAALSCSPAAAPFGARLGDSPLKGCRKVFSPSGLLAFCVPWLFAHLLGHFVMFPLFYKTF